MKERQVKVSREWLGNTIPTALDMILKGLSQPVWYTDTFGITPQKALENIIFTLREQAKDANGKI